MISPDAVPVICAEVEGLLAFGDRLVRAGVQVRLTGADVHAIWQGLAEAYQAPEATMLLAAMVAVRDGAADLGEDLQAAGQALLDYAAEVREPLSQ